MKANFDKVVETEIEVTGPLAITDLEFDSHGRPKIATYPGRYLLQVFARRCETVARNPRWQFDGEPTEQHEIWLSPIRDGEPLIYP